MKKSSTIALALGVSALVTSGCYTVVNSPYASVREKEPEYTSSRYGERPAGETPRRDRRDDRYGSSGYGSGGSGGGLPIFGYGSNSGLYGFGSGYNSYPYSSAYGPNGYGVDPYYQGDTGYYIPPGYELVTSQELEQLRLNGVEPANTDPVVVPTAAEVKALQEEQLEQDRYIWAERGTRSRSVPTGISRSSTGSSSGSAKTAKPATKSAKPATKSAKPAKSSSTKSTSSSGKGAPKKRRR